MSKYKVIKLFTDLQDNGHRYSVGDIFPRDGLKVSSKRLAELSSSNNRQHKPLIKEIVEEVKADSQPEPVSEAESEKPKARTSRKKKVQE